MKRQLVSDMDSPSGSGRKPVSWRGVFILMVDWGRSEIEFYYVPNRISPCPLSLNKLTYVIYAYIMTVEKYYQ